MITRYRKSLPTHSLHYAVILVVLAGMLLMMSLLARLAYALQDAILLLP